MFLGPALLNPSRSQPLPSSTPPLYVTYSGKADRTDEVPLFPTPLQPGIAPLHTKTKVTMFSFSVFGITCPRARLQPRTCIPHVSHKGEVTTAHMQSCCPSACKQLSDIAGSVQSVKPARQLVRLTDLN